MPRPDQALPAYDRVMRRVERDETSGCLLWLGYKQPKGYGIVGASISRSTGAKNRTALVHRVTWEHERGPIPEGLEVDHICRTRHCVEITHLQLLTPRANKDRADHSARIAALRAKTHCKRQHEFTAENTRWYKGRRQCKACFAFHARKYRKEARLAREAAR